MVVCEISCQAKIGGSATLSQYTQDNVTDTERYRLTMLKDCSWIITVRVFEKDSNRDKFCRALFETMRDLVYRAPDINPQFYIDTRRDDIVSAIFRIYERYNNEYDCLFSREKAAAARKNKKG